MVVDPESPASVAFFVRACGLGVVATVDPTGRPEAALVSVAALDDGMLVIDAPAHARKVANIAATAQVAVVVGWNDGVSLQLEGSAVVAAGAERDTYGAAYNEEFPGSRALDDDFAVIVIRPTWVRAYDATVHPPIVEEAHWT